jgi:hypothetical protein
MRKPALPLLVLAGSVHCLSVLVSRDLTGRGGTGQDGGGMGQMFPFCSHQEAGSRVAGLPELPAAHEGGTVAQERTARRGRRPPVSDPFQWDEENSYRCRARAACPRLPRLE